jgi:hypothetical protein
MNSQELLQKQIPVEITGKVIDEKYLAVLEVKMEEFRKRLKKGVILKIEEVREIVAYQRLVRQKNWQEPNIVKKQTIRKKVIKTKETKEELFKRVGIIK